MQRAPTTTVTKIKTMHSLAPHCYEEAESEKCTNTHVSEQHKQYPTPKVSHAKNGEREREGEKLLRFAKTQMLWLMVFWFLYWSSGGDGRTQQV